MRGKGGGSHTGKGRVARTTSTTPPQSSVELLKLRLLLLGGLRGLVLDSVKVVNKVGDIVIIIVVSSCWWPLLALLDSLVGLGELAEGRERVGAELVEDAGHELGELLDVAGSVHSERVRGHSRVNWTRGDAG